MRPFIHRPLAFISKNNIMTKKDFFVLVVKMFGLYSVISALFSVLPSNISLVLMDLDIIMLAWLAITMIIITGLFVLLIFKSESIVKILKLDKGFDTDTIDLNSLKTKELIKFSVFIIGGLMILENTPSFLSHSLFAFRGEKAGFTMSPKDNIYWATSTLNIIFGYILLTNYAFISELFDRKKNN